jgi:hypothetical protein
LKANALIIRATSRFRTIDAIGVQPTKSTRLKMNKRRQCRNALEIRIPTTDVDVCFTKLNKDEGEAEDEMLMISI